MKAKCSATARPALSLLQFAQRSTIDGLDLQPYQRSFLVALLSSKRLVISGQRSTSSTAIATLLIGSLYSNGQSRGKIGLAGTWRVSKTSKVFGKSLTMCVLDELKVKSHSRQK